MTNLNNTPELVLIVSDLNVPYKVSDIPDQFRELLSSSKINHVLCLGNVGSKEVNEYLKGLSKNFHCVSGDVELSNTFNNSDLAETKVVKIGNFKIGMINGYQIVPWGDLNSLAICRKKLECDILLHGYTGISSFYTFEGKSYINPGSLSGSYSPINQHQIPSFMVLLIDGDFAINYLYEIKEQSRRYEVSKCEFKKLPEEVLDQNQEDED